MTSPLPQPTARRYLMCPPTYFEVSYTINPWMDPSIPVDRELAIEQWENLKSTYESLGHVVTTIDAIPGLPDMVFAANGATVVDGRVFGARFRNSERVPEGPAYLAWLRANGYVEAREPRFVNEGEGDFLCIGNRILAGYGYRTDPAAHLEAEEFLRRGVVALELVDPRFYHLDTALAVLDDTNVAYYPDAFSARSLAVLQALYPDAVIADTRDAQVLGLNAVSDGRNVVLPEAAVGLAAKLAHFGYNPVPVELSELLKAGGSVKCCTLELRG